MHRTLLLSIIFTVAVLVVAAVIIGLLYGTALSQETNRLKEVARSQARIIEAIAQHETKYSHLVPAGSGHGDALASTLAQVRYANDRFSGFGHSGEFTLARREGDSIVFLLNQRHSGPGRSEVIPVSGTRGEPMRRALSGLSGTITGPDYRGITVLAAHEPVNAYGLGIVAKIDLAEVRSPFVRAGLIGIVVALVAVLLGSLLFYRITSPVLRQLQESETRLKNAQGLAHLGSWTLDLVKNELAWSDEVYRIFGLQPQEFGATYEAFLAAVHPDDRAAVDAAYSDSVRESRDGYEIEHRVVRKDTGEVRVVEEKCEHIRNASGRIIRSSGMVHDITERKRAEEALRVADQRKDLAVRVLELINSDGGRADLIRDILQRVKQSTGFDAVGIRLQEGDDFPYYVTSGFPDHFVEAERYLCARDPAGQVVRDSRNRPLLECMCGNVIRGRTDPSQPFFTPGGSFWTNSTTKLLASTTETDRQARTRNRCNGEGYESVALIPLRSGDKTVGLLQLNDHRPGMFTTNLLTFLEGIGTSIGVAIARQRAEETLSETMEDLKRSNAELEQFAYVASHDLQQPLRMVASYVELLGQRYKGRLDERADKYIAYASGGAIRMHRLVNDLLALSRVGTRAAPSAPVSLDRAVALVRDNLTVAIEQSGAVVEVEQLPVVSGDETQLVQLFQNLFDNAIKFRGAAAPRISVTCRDAGTEWEFAVRDNGIGIDPKHAERVFGVFKRLHTAQEYPGTGIGLALCRKIVERHGGRIWVEPAEGGGSVFRFTLPKQPPAGIELPVGMEEKEA